MKSWQQFLGMVNFYSHFILNCASIIQPLTNLSNAKKCDIIVSGNILTDNINTAVSKTVELIHILPNKYLCLTVDASAVAVGVVLQQKDSGSWKPISFISKNLTSTHHKCS